MAVPSVITDLNVVAASNSPAGADSVASNTGPDEYFRALSAIVRREQAQGTATASAATVDLGAITTGSYLHITGSTGPITSFGTVAAGVERKLVFDSTPTITHNATSMILLGGKNRTLAAGDVCVFRSEGSGNWREIAYHPAKLPVVNVRRFGAVGDGATNDAAAIQAAANALGGPGVLFFQNDGSTTYKVSGTVTLPIGVSIDFNGCTIDVSAATGEVFSYNAGAASFSFTAPPTTVSNGKFTGNALNTSCYPFKLTRIPYVTLRDLKIFTCNVADVYGECILTNFDNVVNYAPIGTSYKFQLGTGAFGPNGTVLNSCYIEEAANSGVVGVQVNSGSVGLRGCYLEALQTCVSVNGGDVAVHNTAFSLRKFNNAAAFIFDSVTSGSTFVADDCTFNFGEGTSAYALYGFIVNCALSVKLTGNVFSSLHIATSSSTVFSPTAEINGICSGNRFYCLAGSALQTIFGMGSPTSAVGYLSFTGNNVYGEVGSQVKFTSAAPAGTLAQCTISGNSFLRLSSMLGMNGGIVSGNNFQGSAITIQWGAAVGGSLTSNTFGSAPTVSNPLFVEGNYGYEYGNTQHTRITTGAIAAGAFANVVVTWVRAWPSTNYSISAVVFEPTFGATSITVEQVAAITATTATIVVKNNSATPLTGTLHATATYDQFL